MNDTVVTMKLIRAVVFDMDGLLVDSEPYWEAARAAYCASMGCDWRSEDEQTVKGSNSKEWAERIAQRCRLDVAAQEIVDGVIHEVEARYALNLPLLPGAVETVKALAQRVPLGLASSSPRSLIEYVLGEAGILELFAACVSSDEAGRGKPAPDVFLLAAGRLHVEPSSVAVFEDSSAGILAGKNAGMHVIAVPNVHYPPSKEALAQADLVLDSLQQFDTSYLTYLQSSPDEGTSPSISM